MKLTCVFLLRKLYLLHSKKPEHSETILGIEDFDATKKSASKVWNERGSYRKYSDEQRLKIRNTAVKTALLWAYVNSKNHFQT